MVIGWLQRELAGGSQSAWGLVEATQRSVHLPCLLVPQPAHAVLAGAMADGLRPEIFGELPPEIKRAIQMHDTGWAASDAQQIQRLRAEGPHAGKAAPVSFVAVPPAETVEAWTASIDSVEPLSRVGAILVSRHFCLLAQQHLVPHQKFVEGEKLRQRRLEGSTLQSGQKPGADELDRWTAALGFCDLVSLYLLCGLHNEVEVPLAHPASVEAKTAPRVKMQRQERALRFSPETVRPGCILTIQALVHPVPKQGPRAQTLTWEVQ
jgi:Protein of unknown function (DUF3891)